MRLTGLGVSPGVAVGRALVLTRRALDIRYRVRPEDVPREIDRVSRATSDARRQLQEIQRRLAGAPDADPASIFDAQLLMLDDPLLAGRANQLIQEERINAEWAVRRAADELVAGLGRAEDEYLRERTSDVADVAGRLRLNLRAGRGAPAAAALMRVSGPVILVADELSASVAAQVDWGEVAGFVSDTGSWTYHTAILARSLRVPAIVGLRAASAVVPPGARMAIDGDAGEAIVDPSEDDLHALEARRRLSQARAATVDAVRPLPPVTPDGVRVTLEANIELADEAADARAHGAEGIGLYRSEFLPATPAGAAPDEEAQYETYRRVIEAMAPGRVTVRTFDGQEGGAAGELGAPRGRAGLRGLRLSLARRDAFRVQLRALLRASRHGRLRILFPFVTSAEEFLEARRLVAEVASDLRADGHETREVPVGAMIEIPAAAVIADLLAAEADFLSVGTNDLVQFALAVDRADERVSHLYEPLHPAILRLIRAVVRGARRHGRPLAVCGEMAADPALAVLLVGLGVTELSMRPGALSAVTRALRATPAGEARRLAARALRAATAAEVERQLGAVLAPEHAEKRG